MLCWLAWYRFFTEEAHGEGFVDPATPEVAIAVVDGRRGAASEARSCSRSVGAPASTASPESRSR